MRLMEITERPATTTPLLTVTERAATKIRELLAEEEDVSVLRVAIQGGGCSGFQYGLGFDRGAQEGDIEFSMHGVDVVVDPFSAPYLSGAEIDYVDSIQSSGFAITTRTRPRPAAAATPSRWRRAPSRRRARPA